MCKKLLLILIVLLVGWFSPRAVRAQAPVESLHIVLVIDDSGSMADNDDQNLRLVAAKLLISLLETQDQVAVIRFSTDSQVVAPFTPMDPDSKRDLMAKLDQDFYSEGRTDIRAALAQARTLMAGAPVGQGRVILMTDGLPAILDWQSRTPTSDELEAYVEETLAVAQEIGKPVLSVALGDQVDRVFLQSISQVTRGRYFEAATALDLPAVYLDVLSELQDRTIVGPGQSAAPGEALVEVHPYAQSVGFVVVREPQVTATLYPPGVSEPFDLAAPGMVAFHEPQFDVLVVPDLPSGPWRVALRGRGQADVKAIVISSRLQLDLLSPANKAACVGQPWLISARLSLIERDGGLVPLTGADVPGSLAQVTLPDGQTETLTLQDEVDDGQFTAFFEGTDQSGTYQIVLQTSAGGLDTRRTAEIAARACPGLAIVAPLDGASFEVTPDQAIAIEARLVEGEDHLLDKGGAVALVTDAAGNQVMLSLTDAGAGKYRGEFVPQAPGGVKIQVSLEGAVWQGLPVQAQTEPVHVTVTVIPPDPWAFYRAWMRMAALALGILALLLLRRWVHQPKLDGELIYGLPGGRPEYEPVQGRVVYLKVQDGYLTAGRNRRGAQAMLRAERHGDVHLLPLNSVRLTKNNIPVRQGGSLVGPRDIIRLEGLEIRFESFREE